MSEQINDLVQHALDQDYNKANKVFGELMSVKLTDVLDQEKIKLADQIYNGVEDPEEDIEDEDLEDLEDEDEEDGEESDDQLEFDLEPEDTEGAEEGEATDDSKTGGTDGGAEDDAEEKEL